MRNMTVAVAVFFAALAAPLQALAQDRLARFEGGIGVIPTGSANTTTRGVTAAGQIWVISRLSADIKTDGRISVDGRGLLLGAGNNVGRNANQSVRARLFCNGTAPTFADASSHQSGLVPLEPNGDFRIEDTLDPSVPAECNNPVLLIVNPNGSWFAAGIPKL
jgi:hypothetical protein